MRFNSPHRLDTQHEQHLHAIINTTNTSFDIIGSLADRNSITTALLAVKSIGHNEKELVAMIHLDSTQATAKQQLSDIITWIEHHKTWLAHQGITHWTLRGDTNIDLAKLNSSGQLENQMAVIQQAKQLGTIQAAYHSNLAAKSRTVGGQPDKYFIEKKDAKGLVLSGSFGEPMPTEAIVEMTILGTPQLDDNALDLVHNAYYSRAVLDHAEMSHSDITALNIQPLPEHDIEIANLRAGKTLQDYRAANLELLATFTKSLQSVITLKRLFPPTDRIKHIDTLLTTASGEQRSALELERQDFQTEIELIKTIMAYRGDIKPAGECMAAINTWCHHADKYNLTDTRLEAFKKAKRDLLYSDGLRSIIKTIKLPIGDGSLTAVTDEIERRWTDYVDMVRKHQTEGDNAAKCAIEAGKLFTALLFSSGSPGDPEPFKQRFRGQADIGLDVSRGFVFPHDRNIADATKQRQAMVAALLANEHAVLMTCEISTSALQALCPDTHSVLHAGTATQQLTNATLSQGLLHGPDMYNTIMCFDHLAPGNIHLLNDGKAFTVIMPEAASLSNPDIISAEYEPEQGQLVFRRLELLLNFFSRTTRYTTQGSNFFKRVSQSFHEYLHTLFQEAQHEKLAMIINKLLFAAAVTNHPDQIQHELKSALLLGKNGSHKQSTLGTRIIKSADYQTCLEALADNQAATPPHTPKHQ